MAINKDKIHDLVEIFYQAPFKTFYVNSKNGQSFIKQFAVFVSLGITTSLQVINNIKEIMTKVEGGKYKTKLVVFKSVSISGQFLNSVLPIEESEICQYDMLESNYPTPRWNEEDTAQLIEDYKKKKNEGVVAQLEKLITKINSNPSGWKNCFIYQEKPDEFNIFHTKVNYKKDPDGSEYRIGIYVEEIN